MPPHAADRSVVGNAGFEIGDVDQFYEDGAPKFLAADSLGVAVSP